MTDSIEIPTKKTPPPIAVLARQIEALKNDSTPEKLKTVEPRISHLDERIKVLKNSREEHFGELAKMNEEFEKIREELEIKNFLEKFAVSEKVAKFLKDNPKKKPAELAPAEFTTNPELQDPKIWENILEDAKNGSKVAEKGLSVLKKLEKDSSIDPKKELEKTPEGKGILETVKKNPLLVGAFLFTSGVAIYQFLKKDSKIRNKVGGLVSGGVATYLGISLLKKNFGDSLINFFGQKLLGEKKWKQVEAFFGEKDKKDKPKKTPEEVEKYGKMVPLSKAIGNYKTSAEDALRPITELAKRRKDALAILATAGFVSSGTVRDLTLGVTKMTAGSAFTLAKLPLKAVKGFPLTSLFAATGLLLSYAKIKKTAGEFKVPKDPENMQKFLRAKIKDSGKKLGNLNIPAIPDAHIPIIADILTNERQLDEFVAPAKEMLAGLVEVGFEKVELTEKELIQKRNLTGLESFRDTIKDIKKPESTTALAVIKAVKIKVENGELITLADIEKIKVAVAPLGFAIRAEDGRLKSVILGENGVARAQSVCVDPALPAAEQFKVAQTFFVESDNWIDAAGKTVEIPFEQIRLALGNLREDVKTETEVGEVIERKLKEGWVLTIIGGTLSLVGTAGEKYILGGAEMIWNSNLFPGGEKFSCVEMAIEYAEGILPIAAIGTASALARGGWKAFSPGRVLFRTAFYPFVGTKKVLSHIAHPLLDRNPKAILTNPVIETTSFLKEFKHHWQSKFTWLEGIARTEAQRVSALHADIRDLNRSKKLLAEANGSFGRKRGALLKNVREILGDVEVKDRVFGKADKAGKASLNNIGKGTKNIQRSIKKINEIIREKKQAIKQIRKGIPPETNRINPLRKPETNEIKNYLKWCEKNGVKPVASKIMTKRLATFGQEALRIGATPLMILLTIHNIESAPPAQRNEVIAENAASFVSFYLALQYGGATFAAIPGPLLTKSVGAISVAMLSFFVGQKGIEEFSSAVLKKINLNFSEGSNTDDALLGLETVFGLGGLPTFLVNKFHTGENAQEFLERDMPALFHKGEFISRFRYNSVGEWNKRIQKKINRASLIPEKSFLQTLLINENWKKMQAAKMAKLKAEKNISSGENLKQINLKIKRQEKLLKRIGQYDEEKFKNNKFIQEGQEKLLEQEILASTARPKK